MSLYQQRCRLSLLAAKAQQCWGIITGSNYHILKGRSKELLAILHERIFLANQSNAHS